MTYFTTSLVTGDHGILPVYYILVMVTINIYFHLLFYLNRFFSDQ